MIYLFGAEWCANCKMVKPMLANVKYEYIDIDSDEGTILAAKHGIRSLPTLLNTDTLDRFSGVPRNVADLKEKLGL
ncbi:hypothetical protein OFDDKENP_00062 [Aeromonas phage B614]|nr:hypothetical protein OFDDKENP_00062 [Aeromonas phage B614]UYD58212.1 hypothetical protein JNEOFJEA_00115 [Aeromonas phage UP87]UYD58575.1 hypothetical protein IPAKJDPM_00232 [Aeromonas phage avDM14-QBC]UYD58789.1 hypothetical protein HNNIDBEH_00196 [Aeromonas phage avDM10-HWA]UYD58907.1 hypothetical protein OFOPOMKI_00057 [Aeromonas phage avDM7-IJDJ]UYD59966.1 hypothetical protein LEHPIFIF_00210 [Aeromonas phage avDM9-HANS]